MIPVALFTSGFIQVILGIAFMFFLPGFCTVSALYPRNEHWSALQKFAISLGSSMAIIPIIGLILNYSPWGIRVSSAIISVSIYTIVISLVAWLRKRNLGLDQSISDNLHTLVDLFSGGWRKLTTVNKALSIILILVIMGSIGTVGYVTLNPRQNGTYTEFYILGQNGVDGDYHKTIHIGEPLYLTIGIVNKEIEATDYLIDVMVNGNSVNKIDNIILAGGEIWEHEVPFYPSEPGLNQELELVLYKTGEIETYRSLRLWLDIVS